MADPTPLEIILDEMRDFRNEVRNNFKSTNTRLGALEEWKALTTGKVWGISAVVSLLCTGFGYLVKTLWN